MNKFISVNVFSDKEYIIIISPPPDGNEASTFSIAPDTGIVRVWNPLSLSPGGHSLNVSATDGVYTAYARLDVRVVPVNDHAPLFDVDAYTAEVCLVFFSVNKNFL